MRKENKGTDEQTGLNLSMIGEIKELGINLQGLDKSESKQIIQNYKKETKMDNYGRIDEILNEFEVD